MPPEKIVPKYCMQEKCTLQEKNTPENLSGKVRHEKKHSKNIYYYNLIKFRFLKVLDLIMKLSKDFFREKGIYDTMSNIPRILGYFLL